MKKLIAALVAGLFAAVTFSVMADDKVKSGGDMAKPGRAIDEGKTVKSGGDMSKPGRAADEEKAPAKKSKKKKKKDAQ
jgi:hypothetical protein